MKKKTKFFDTRLGRMVEPEEFVGLVTRDYCAVAATTLMKEAEYIRKNFDYGSRVDPPSLEGDARARSIADTLEYQAKLLAPHLFGADKGK